MKKTYELNEFSSIEKIIELIKKDFPKITINNISGISITENQLNSSKTSQLHHFTPIYFGTEIMVPYPPIEKNIFRVHIKKQDNSIAQVAEMKELFISHISDITQLEYSLFGFKHLDYTILKNNMLKNEKTPEELRSEHFITAVSLGEIIYYN